MHWNRLYFDNLYWILIQRNTKFFIEIVSNLYFQTDECKCQVRREKNTGEDNFIIIEHYLSIIVNNLQIY